MWSLPYKVAEVRIQWKAARVKGILTDDERLVHIQTVKFVQKPQTAIHRLCVTGSLAEAKSGMIGN